MRNNFLFKSVLICVVFGCLTIPFADASNYKYFLGFYISFSATLLAGRLELK